MKGRLKTELLAALEAQLASARSSHEAAVSAATDDEARPENDKDTRGLEQSYLARGHAQRVGELETAIAVVGTFAPRAFGDTDPIALGALITFEEDARRRTLWLAPHGGGIELTGDVTVVTPTSPLGRALLGKRVDDDVELGKRSLTITNVA